MKIKVKKDTDQVEFLYSRKDFLNYGLKRTFKFGADLKVLKSADDPKSLYIKGYASTPDKDRVDDVIAMEALEKSKDDLLQEGSNTVFYNHNKSIPIGRVTKTALDNKGLICEIKISNADDVKDIRTKIKEKILKSLSIGGRFKKVQVERGEDGEITSFKVLELELFEVSVVGIPCNAKASIFDVVEKSFTNFEDGNSNKKEENMKIKKSKKDKATGDGTISNTNAGMTADQVHGIVKGYMDPVQKSLATIHEAVGKMHEHMMKQLADYQNPTNDQRKDKSDDKKSEKTSETEMPEWAKTIVDENKKLMETIEAASGNKRKGYVAPKTDEGDEDLDDEEEEEEEVEESGDPEKCLDPENPASVVYVKWLLGTDPREKSGQGQLAIFEKLSKEEQDAAKAIYFKLMQKVTRKERLS